MSKIQVILTDNVAGHGKKGEVVSVAEGYARNFIIKQNKGIIATPEELKKLENKAIKKDKEEQKKKEDAIAQKATLETKELTLKVKVGAGGKVFGAITSKEVVEAIEKTFGLKLDKKKVEANFKTTGAHIAEVKLHADVKASVKVIVVGE